MYRCGRKNLIILLTLAIIMLGSGIAQAEDEIEFELDKVVVTATKTPTKLKDVPSSVEVITSKELEKRHVRMLSDVLKTLPGVYVRNDKGLIGSHSSEDISMRGFMGKGYVAFLVDGQPINNGYSGLVDFSNIPVENIERIEVIKGSASVLYGSNAMGGVINVITKSKPEEAVTIHTSIGEMGTRSGSVSASGSAGSLDYFVNAQKIKADGYVTTKEADGKNGMERENYGAKLVYHFNESSKLSITADKSNHDYFYEKSPNKGSIDEDGISLIYENQFNDKSYLKAAFSQHDWDSWSLFNKKDTSEIATSKQFDLQYNYKLSTRDLLTFGYVYKREKADVNVFGGDNKLSGGKTETHSLYIQDKHLLNDKTDLYLGLRYDYWKLKDAYDYKYIGGHLIPQQVDNASNSNFSPKIALVYRANDKLTLRTSVSKGFNTPNLYQLFGLKTSTKGYIYLPNTNLKPEESVNYEVGLDYQFDKTLLGKMTFFYSNFDNEIVTTEISPTEAKRINGGDNKIKGIELSLQKEWNENWSSFINYSYVDNKAVNFGVMQVIKTIPYNTFNFGINYQQDKWLGSLVGSYVSDPDHKDTSGYLSRQAYFVLDFKLAYKFDADTFVALSVDNLLDRDYYSIYKAPGRAAYLEFTKKF